MNPPLDTAYNRLDEAHRAWHTALDGYHRVEDFRAGINTAIQALRNLTFALQKQKDSLLDFEEWYLVWQEKMSSNPVLKALHGARNIIVKQEDLKLLSTAVATTRGWVEFEKMSFSFNPIADSRTVAKGFYDTYAKLLPLPEEGKSRALFIFERKWVYEKIPNFELLEAISIAYHFFYEMLKDASIKFSQPLKENYKTGDFCLAEFNDKDRLKCMAITSEERSIVFGFDDGAIFEPRHAFNVHHTEADLESAYKKYGAFWNSEDIVGMLKDKFPTGEPYDKMKLFAQVAIGNLKRDKHLEPVAFIFKESNEPIILSLSFDNQQQKMLSMDKVATEIIKNNGKHVLFMAEAWSYKIGNKIPTRDNSKSATGEHVQISYISSKGGGTISIPFHKNLLGNIVFSEPKIIEFSSEDNKYFIIKPLIDALIKVNE